MSATFGFFDSGLGGLTVLYQARRMVSGTYLYYADRDHVPYGSRSKEEIIRYTMDAASFLVREGAQILVIACNTATSMAIPMLRENMPVPVIGMEPAIRPALRTYPGEKILLCATPVTLAGEKLRLLLEEQAALFGVPLTDIVPLPLPGLVTMAEQGEFSYEAVVPYLRREIRRVASFHEKYGVVVLGCTHFTLFRDSFRQVLGDNIAFVDGTEGTVRQLCRVAQQQGIVPGKNRMRYFVSGREADEQERHRMEQIFDRMDLLDRMEACKQL